ncbi:hypothetical protein [Mesomycoplasma ovipneumoniae]|uniref:hypothetical protein n=1 Tax=Mesomycoplasma ovipneumoniae TaxID=29562 RepID=UPI0029642F61|nr:hypothetical protein [Mesomycoplasma ovipneumoniae]
MPNILIVGKRVGLEDERGVDNILLNWNYETKKVKYFILRIYEDLIDITSKNYRKCGG